jgi:hypothetical protein
VPAVRGSGLVDLIELVLTRPSGVGGLLGAIRGDIASDVRDVLKQLAELGVGEDELAAGTRLA